MISHTATDPIARIAALSRVAGLWRALIGSLAPVTAQAAGRVGALGLSWCSLVRARVRVRGRVRYGFDNLVLGRVGVLRYTSSNEVVSPLIPGSF